MKMRGKLVVRRGGKDSIVSWWAHAKFEGVENNIGFGSTPEVATRMYLRELRKYGPRLLKSDGAK